MLMCSLLCSSDVIAAISLISYEQQPKLFSIVFGEGIMNDAVSIILFNTVMKYTSKNSVITVKTPFEIITNFFGLGINSLFVGIIFGLLSSYILKRFRVFAQNPVSESMMIFCFGYLSYVISESAHYSGIISLLTCGIAMAHYTWYNLSPQGKQSSFIVFQFLGYLTEAFVFAYLGLTFFSYSSYNWSPHLFLVELGVIMVGRIFGTLGLIGLLRLFGYQSGISMKELIFIWYAGMIRGAIAFGLVLRIDKSFVNRDVIVTTSLSLVIFTTVVFGSTVGLVQRCLFGKRENHSEVDNSKKVNEREVTTTPDRLDQISENSKDYESVDLSEASSNYQALLHPNQEEAESATHRIKQYTVHTGCVKYLRRFDEVIMKPIFIYKYEKKMQKKSKEFFELFMKQGDQIEEDFKKDARSKKKAVDLQSDDKFRPAGDLGSRHSALTAEKRPSLQQSIVSRSFVARKSIRVSSVGMHPPPPMKEEKISNNA